MTHTTVSLRANDLTFSAIEAGPATGPVVVLLHGFPDSPASFEHQIEALVAHGCRVVAPTLRGYEPSSQPADGDYSLVALADDVIGWLDHLDVARAHLVGHDWGAAITYLTATRHPERIITATAMAVPPLARIPEAVRRVPRQIMRSWYMTFFQLPWVAERALRARDQAFVQWLWRRWSPSLELNERNSRIVREQFDEPGVIEAALGYYRANATPPLLLGMQTNEAMALEEIPVPMLVLHGADDGCMDPRLFAAAIDEADFPAGVRLVEVEDCGHFLHLERPALVNELIVEHLRL